MVRRRPALIGSTEGASIVRSPGSSSDQPSTISRSSSRRWMSWILQRSRSRWLTVILLCLIVWIVVDQSSFLVELPAVNQADDDGELDAFETRHLMPIMIPSFNANREASFLVTPPPMIYTSPFEKQQATEADYADLEIGRKEFRREILPVDNLRYNLFRRRQLKKMDQTSEDETTYHADELEYSACQRPSWRDWYFPTCNSFHEIDLWRATDDAVPSFDSYFFGHGHYRDAWKISSENDASPFVLKTTRIRHDMDAEFLAEIKMDALIMTVLLQSPRIVNIMGACSGSLAVEAVDVNMLDQWIPRYRATKYKASVDVPGLHVKGDVRSENNLTMSNKIDDAVDIASAIADMHGYSGGVIVHDDLMPDQWLRRNDGQLVLSDYNRAYVLAWNVEENKYCPILDRRVGNYYDAPELMLDTEENEKINIYQLGGHIYALITGLRVYQENSLEKARNRVRKGDLPYVDLAFRNGTYVERELTRIMERCWTHDPFERPDIFEVLRDLREVQARHRQEASK
jgi:serine/threonine protein kinase